MKFAIFDLHCIRETQIPTTRRPRTGDLRVRALFVGIYAGASVVERQR